MRPDQAPSTPELSVVVPVWNEAGNIEPLIAEITSVLEGKVNYEIVYVDDGSRDETPERLIRASKETPRLRVLRHRIRCGQSAAIRTGVKAARAAWVATLDGDGQNDPADIPTLLAILQQADRPPRLRMVVGERRRRKDNWIKRASSRVANAVRRAFLEDDTPDTGCGLKLIHRETFLDLPFFDHMHRFLPALVLRERGQVLSVEVHHRPRSRGTSKYGLFDRLWVGLVDLLGVLWLRRRAKQPEVTEIK